MSQEQEKNKSSAKGKVILLGLVFIIAGVLIIFLNVRKKNYTATITEITDTYTSHSNKGKSSKKVRYNEKVKIKYVDKNGKTKNVSNVRIKRNSKKSLPKKGETIKITAGLLKTAEYDPIAFGSAAAVFIVVGLLLIIVALRLGKKKSDI